jgi:hypothetical protein
MRIFGYNINVEKAKFQPKSYFLKAAEKLGWAERGIGKFFHSIPLVNMVTDPIRDSLSNKYTNDRRARNYEKDERQNLEQQEKHHYQKGSAIDPWASTLH